MSGLRRLELAVALGHHRSFARAAEAAGVTQPTLSRAIAALEEDLGVRLFDRTTRRVEPTPEGSLFLGRAATLLADAARLTEVLGDYRELRSGRLKLGAGPYALELSVIECLVRLSLRHPGLGLEVVEGPWRDFGPRLLSGELELAVVESSLVAADPRFRVEPLPVHDGYFYCRPGHPLAGRARLALADVLAHPIVGAPIPARVLRLGELAGLPLAFDPVTGDFLPHVTTTSVATAKAIVQRTDGIGIAACMLIDPELRSGALQILDAEVPKLRTAYGVVFLRDRSLSPAALAFVATLREVETELVAKAAVTLRRAGRASRRPRRPAPR